MFYKKIIIKLKIIIRTLITLPSRIFFGNCISIQNNLFPFLKIKFWKINFSSMPLVENGYEKIQFNLKNKLIFDIKNQFDELINNPNKTHTYRNHDKKIILNNPFDIRGIKNICKIFDKNLIDYFNGNYKVIKLSCWRTLYDRSVDSPNEKYIYSNYWHFDDYRSDILKVFVLLNNNTSKNTGSTKLIDRKDTKLATRTLKFIDTSISNSKFDNYAKEKNLIIHCDGNLGDVFIINTSRCLHSASIPHFGTYRDLIQFEVTHSNIDKDPFYQLTNI